MSIPLPIAHEMWFDSNRFPLAWSFYGSQPQLRPLVSSLRLPARPRHALPALRGALQS